MDKPLIYSFKEFKNFAVDYWFTVLLDSLPSNFKEVTVEVVECPDLRNAPYHLAAEGNNNFLDSIFNFHCIVVKVCPVPLH